MVLPADSAMLYEERNVGIGSDSRSLALSPDFEMKYASSALTMRFLSPVL